MRFTLDAAAVGVGLVALTKDRGLRLDWTVDGTVPPPSASTSTDTVAGAGAGAVSSAVSGAGRVGLGEWGVVGGIVGVGALVGGL